MLEEYFDHAPHLESELCRRGKHARLEILQHTNMDSGEIAYVRQHQPLGLGMRCGVPDARLQMNLLPSSCLMT